MANYVLHKKWVHKESMILLKFPDHYLQLIEIRAFEVHHNYSMLKDNLV